MLSAAHHGVLASRLRLAFGLTQAEMARIFGLNEKSLTRLEHTTQWTPTAQRLLRAILECPVDRAEALLAQVVEGLVLDTAPESAAQLIASQAVRALRGNAASPTRGSHTRVRDLLEHRTKTVEWVYWATSARADADETLRLADKHGILCRPLWNSQGVVSDYLTRVAPGDRVLLCHNGAPIAWFALQKARHGDKRSVRPALPPVFRFVAPSTALGRALAASGYRNQNGELSGARDVPFSGLAVKRVRRELVVPAPRGRGVRDAMTPFAPASGVQT